MKDALSDQGVIFVGSKEGLDKYPEIFRPWFGKVIPTADNKYSALNSAVFSGGSFIYVPKGVKVKHPLQAYFRINAENFGQFERTLIIADEGAELTYMEGCTAPKFETATLHSAVVELVALKGAKIQYITVQNWSANVFNLVTKRAMAMEEAEVKWIDCNIGSRLTMKYPGVILKGRKARGEVISIALANNGQHQDTGAKMIHAADETTSNIVSKSISIGKGRSSYRGLVHIPRHLKGCKNNTECDALLINSDSRTDTYPAITVRGESNSVQHEASVSKVSAEQIFYMQQRGLTEGQAMSLSVNGFVNDLVNQFPMEYSVELKRLIDLEMEGSVG
jgi:Fe-S cluster assembly protein SufB